MIKKLITTIKNMINSILPVLKTLFVETFQGYNFLMVIPLFIIAYILNMPYLYIVGFLFYINFFDTLGYGEILNKLYYSDNALYHKALPFYRILQKLNTVLLTLFVYMLTNGDLLITILCFSVNYAGVQDLLYYLFRREVFCNEYTWMTWTPYSMFKKIFFKTSTLNKTEFILQAIISHIITITVYIILR